MNETTTEEMVTITVDGQQLQARKGAMLIEVTDVQNIKVPRFCYHKKLAISANCRMCLVEIISGGKPGLVASCHYPVQSGLVIETDTKKVHKARKMMLELLLARTPDSQILLEMAKDYGIEESRIESEEKDDCIFVYF